MKVTVQVMIDTDDESCPTVVREVFSLQRGVLTPDTLGLHLAEAKDLLGAVQQTLVEAQAQAAVTAAVPCPHCARPRRHKDTRRIVVRTLFGTLRLASPRWSHCACRPRPTHTFGPLAQLLPDRATPELVYLEAKFGGLVSYGLSAKLLAEVLPLGRTLHATALRQHTYRVAQRLDDELGPETPIPHRGLPGRREELPRPDLPLTVSLDGGYVHSARQRSRRDGWFEVIAGKSVPTDGPAKCFGFVQIYDTKPKRRLFELLV
jgi:hypothetical protein